MLVSLLNYHGCLDRSGGQSICSNGGFLPRFPESVYRQRGISHHLRPYLRPVGCGIGAAFGPVTVLASYWRRFNFWGAVPSALAGVTITSAWGYLSGGPSGMWNIQPATPGFLVATLVAIMVSLLPPKPSGEVVDLFDRVNSDSGRGRRSPASEEL